MADYSNTITFNGVTLSILSATPVSTQKTHKSVIGKTLVQNKVVGLAAKQWEISVSGIIVGDAVSDIGTKRAAIEALNDVQPHAYIDGIHDGTYYMLPESLTFQDSGDNAGMSYRYTFKLIEQ